MAFGQTLRCPGELVDWAGNIETQIHSAENVQVDAADADRTESGKPLSMA
jgi:hypothetical protein